MSYMGSFYSVLRSFFKTMDEEVSFTISILIKQIFNSFANSSLISICKSFDETVNIKSGLISLYIFLRISVAFLLPNRNSSLIVKT